MIETLEIGHPNFSIEITTLHKGHMVDVKLINNVRRAKEPKEQVMVETYMDEPTMSNIVLEPSMTN